MYVSKAVISFRRHVLHIHEALFYNLGSVIIQPLNVIFCYICLPLPFFSVLKSEDYYRTEKKISLFIHFNKAADEILDQA